MTSLDGKVVMITGGSRGVGLATGRLLLAEGASVALVARNHALLDEAVLMLGSGASNKTIGVTADVSDAASMEAAVATVERELGGLDVLVNNAGIGRYGPVAEHPIDEWRQVIETNVLGVFYATRAALPALRRRGGGQIVAISSGAARTGYPNMSAYCTSKAALEGFMRALAAETANEAIRCMTIIPGGILTDFGIRTRDDRLKSGQKFLEPDDVAEAIRFVLTQPERAWTQEMTVWPR